MFNKVSELNKMRAQAKQMQRELAQIEETHEDGGIKVKVTGDQRVTYLKVDGEDREDIARAINKAMKKVQKTAAKKMLEMGGGLSGLLGGMGK